MSSVALFLSRLADGDLRDSTGNSIRYYRTPWSVLYCNVEPVFGGLSRAARWQCLSGTEVRPAGAGAAVAVGMAAGV